MFVLFHRRAADRACLSLSFLLTLACGVPVPARPANVPGSAEWAGGADGGAWIDCRWEAKEPATLYSCTTFNDNTGEVWARGQFVLSRTNRAPEPHEGRFITIAGPRSDRPSYRSFDGSVIYLSTGELLVPDGWVDHPWENGHGKRVHYSLGEETEEVEY